MKVATDHAIGGEMAGTVGEIMDGGDSDYASEILELKGKFQTAVNDKLDKEHRDRVVIFVDDLDRLQPLKAIELLEVLKLFLDCENCIFILAVDYEVVTLGIKQKFGEDVSDVKGKSFFDKIIQLPFKMPVAQYDIRKYVKDMMNRMDIPTDDKNVQLFTNLIHASMGFNPRSMKRLFNTYELLDIITKATVRGIDEAVRKRILFAIICTQMSFEELYLYLTSTRIDADTFTALRSQDTAQEALSEIYANTDVSEELLHKIVLFMPYFIDALQIDEDDNLSEIELENLKVILKCSVVTSVNANSGEENNESLEWEYRDRNKKLVKETAELLKSIGTFSAWMPRKARDGVKISDISGYYKWNTDAGFDCILEYYLSRIDDFTIGVHIYISQENSNGQVFFDTLGDNPLKLSIKPVKVEWGRYIYRNVLRFNDDDPNSTEQIASIVKNAYESLKSILNGKNI
ncbi:MAG: KAP family NTPase [Butyrivibrio sp.]|nr:KAP family NTPase [Butyrivibrio sp.]